MLLIDQSIARVRAFRQRHGMSRKALADLVGVQWSLLRRLDDPTWNPTAKTLRTLEQVVPSDFDHANDDGPVGAVGPLPSAEGL